MSRIAVITGAASGIGLKTAERLLREGWTVWGLDLSEDRLREAACLLGHGGNRFHIAECDVASVSSTVRAFGAVANSSPRIHALICSAGVVRVGSLEENTPEDVDLMLGVNVKGPWLCVRTALPLLRHGATLEEPSRVVIIGSVSGLRPKIGTGMYAASKAAIHVLTGIMAVELAASGVIVNAIAPGTTDTPMIASMIKSSAKGQVKLSGKSPLGRVGRPEDIAGVVSFFLGDDARYVNGVVLPVDGGTRAAHVG